MIENLLAVNVEHTGIKLLHNEDHTHFKLRCVCGTDTGLKTPEDGPLKTGQQIEMARFIEAHKNCK